MTCFVYLHGFNSVFNPSVKKITQIVAKVPGATCVGATLRYDNISYAITRAEVLVEDVMSKYDGEIIIIGTSLGGFIARYLAEKYKLRLITINPALEPWVALRHLAGVPQQNYSTGEVSEVTTEWLESLKAFSVPTLTVASLSIIATDDELFNFSEATIASLNRQSRVILTTGGHRMEVLPDHVLVEISKFVNQEINSGSF